MSQSDPNNPQNNTSWLQPAFDTIKSVVQAAQDLPNYQKLALLLIVLFLIAFIILLAFGSPSIDIPIILAGLGILVIVFTFVYLMSKSSNSNSTTTPPADGPPPANGAKPNKQELTEQELTELYLKELIDRCGWVSTTAYDPKARYLQAKKLHLTAVFTDLDVENEKHRAQIADQREFSRDPAEKETRQSVFVSLNNHPQLVLLGKPGSGKSILVNYITLCLAGEALGKTEFNLSRLSQKGWALPALLPVRIVLRDYAARALLEGKSIWEFITDELQEVQDGRYTNLSPYAPSLEKTLKQKGGILLLDGYDEVPDAHERREQLQKAIADFRRGFGKVRILITSRPYAYTATDANNQKVWQLPDFADTELLDFSDTQIDYYIEHWYKAVSADDTNLTETQAAAYAQELQEEVKSPNLRELSPRPLLLAMMCSLHRYKRPLPQERHLLYEDSVDVLLNVWEQPKRTYDAKGQPIKEKSAMVELGIPPAELRTVLNKLAYEVHRDQPDLNGPANIPARKLAGLLYEAPSRKPSIDIDRIIAYIKNRAGLLEDQGPSHRLQGQHVYTFPHRTFQEYLAACYLSGPTFPTEIAKLVREERDRWDEALLLAAARANTPYSVWGLVGKLCPNSIPATPSEITTEDWRGALFASRVLAQNKLKPTNDDKEDQERWQRVHTWHKTIVTNGLLPPRDRGQAGRALAALGDGRPGILRCDDMPLCAVPGGPFWLESWTKGKPSDWYNGLDKPYWIGQYPVTTAQFREFVDDKENNNNFLPSYGDRPLRQPDNWPVVYINWYDALRFTEWLDKRWRKEAWLPEGYRLTLPSEAEWEKAARGGREIPQTPQITTPARLLSLSKQALPMQPNARAGQDLSRRAYPWGDEPEQETLTPQQTLYRANNKEAGIGEPCAVGSFPAGASPYGCLDLSGQVWEWTRSKHGDKYPYPPQPEYETIAAENQEDIVLRGGSHYNNQNGCSARYGRNPHLYFFVNRGVRVVVSPISHR